jgi:hypothetical protein
MYKPIFTEKEKKKNKRKEKAKEILIASAFLSVFFLAGDFKL